MTACLHVPVMPIDMLVGLDSVVVPYTSQGISPCVNTASTLRFNLAMMPGQQHDCDMQIRAQSENDADDELLSVVLLKGDKKVVTGTQSGVVNLYSWGHMDDCSDRFPGKNCS